MVFCPRLISGFSSLRFVIISVVCSLHLLFWFFFSQLLVCSPSVLLYRLLLVFLVFLLSASRFSGINRFSYLVAFFWCPSFLPLGGGVVSSPISFLSSSSLL